MRYPRSLFKLPAGPWAMRNSIACVKCWRYPGAAEALPPSARSGAFLRSLCLASCFLVRAPALLLYRHGIKPRRWLQRIPQIIAGKLAMPPDPSRSASQATRMAQKCVWTPNSTGVLDDSPRALGVGRGPSKNPRQLCCADAPARILHMAQGLDHSQNGAVRVDSSQEKPARMRVSPKPSRITPDGTSHVVQTGGFSSYR